MSKSKKILNFKLLRWYGHDNNKPTKNKLDFFSQHYKIQNESKDQWTVQCLNHVLTVKPSRHGLGTFTNQPILNQQMINIYPGFIVSEKSLVDKLHHLQPEKQIQVQRYLCQYMLEEAKNPDSVIIKYLDPTNKQGNIEQTWKHNPALYINEPDKDQTPNLIGVWNYDTLRLEHWSCRDIQSGEELLISYGQSYGRDYEHSSSLYSTAYTYKDGKLQIMPLDV